MPKDTLPESNERLDARISDLVARYLNNVRGPLIEIHREDAEAKAKSTANRDRSARRDPIES